MPDVWTMVSDLDEAAQERLAGVLETRGADAQQQRMREAFLRKVEFPAGARVLDVGCGTGVLTRRPARWPQVGSVVGVDLAPSLLDRARTRCTDANVVFQQGDALALPFPDGSFDTVVFDSTLSHVPDVGRAVSEAARVLCVGGVLAVFDGDYSTTTVALGDHDPLQVCVEAMMTGSVTDRWVMRRLPAVVRAGGLDVQRHDHPRVRRDRLRGVPADDRRARRGHARDVRPDRTGPGQGAARRGPPPGRGRHVLRPD